MPERPAIHPALTQDQSDPSPDVYYGAFRYLNRMFSERRTHRREEIAALDLSMLSFEVKYLMRHLLILQGLYKIMLDTYPNLRGLESVEFRKVINPPLVLTTDDPVRHEWAYFRKVGIHL